jgi:hypothetical protein
MILLPIPSTSFVIHYAITNVLLNFINSELLTSDIISKFVNKWIDNAERYVHE